MIEIFAEIKSRKQYLKLIPNYGANSTKQTTKPHTEIKTKEK